jgi:glycosyltransferase involved in cell wall biosynthesis
MTPRLAVVIPAHNEGTLIRTALRSLLAEAKPGEFEVVVVVNGSTDDTAALAREVAGVRVIEIETASKVAALNAGDDATDLFPRIYLDADVVLSTAAARAIATALEGDAPRVAAPRMVVDTTRSSPPTRAFYRVWELTDYRRRGHIGGGLYALNAAGRRRFGDFPPIIADDTFVQQLFAQHERVSVEEHRFTVRAPATLRAHIRRSARVAAGNEQLVAFFARPDSPRQAEQGWSDGSSIRSLIARVTRTPARWLDFPVYCVGYLGSRALGRRKIRAGALDVWERDETTRT